MKMYLDGRELLFDFPYDQEQVNEMKRVEGARWDKVSRIWRVPITSIASAREFALKYEFDITSDILKFQAPKSITSQGDKRVSLHDEMIYMKFPYERVIISAVKKIPAVSWDGDRYSWRAPLSSITQVIEWANGFDVPVDAGVTAILQRVNTEINTLIEASRSTDADIVVPGLTGELLPYQKAGVAYAANARRTFIADEMGLGKTIQAIATLEYLSSREGDIYPAVIVCPPSLVLNWSYEISKWIPHRRVSAVTNRKSFPVKNSYDVVVVGYSNIQAWQSQLMEHGSYVFDESHYCKTSTAQRTKAAVKIARSTKKNTPVLCLTGTPVTNRPAEYASQLDILGRLKDFGGLWGFYRRYCAAYQDRFGQWNLSGNSHLDELNERLRGACYIRRTKDQVLSELPPVVHSRLVIDGSAPAMKEYVKAEEDILMYIAERARQLAIEQGLPSYNAAMSAMIRAEANEHLVRLSVLRRLAAKAKMEAAIEWIQERVDNGKKVVVAAHHRDVVDELARKFGGLRIQGGMKVEEVEENKRKFQTLSVEEAPVIVLSIQAAKTGHTLTSSEECLFIELPWTPADVDQTYSRLHRLGQKGSVTATYMLTSGTIDEYIYTLIDNKRSVVNAAVEGGEFAETEGAVQLILNLMERASKR
jgi:SNF2 family DNA or RNA helicase